MERNHLNQHSNIPRFEDKEKILNWAHLDEWGGTTSKVSKTIKVASRFYSKLWKTTYKITQVCDMPPIQNIRQSTPIKLTLLRWSRKEMIMRLESTRSLR